MFRTRAGFSAISLTLRAYLSLAEFFSTPRVRARSALPPLLPLPPSLPYSSASSKSTWYLRTEPSTSKRRHSRIVLLFGWNVLLLGIAE